MATSEPPRTRPGGEMSLRMSRVAHHSTRPEVLLRRELHRRGLRYRLQTRVPGNNRRRIDIALTRARVAVYVDGCFWHGCPEHLHVPKANREWWEWKLAATYRRDRDTDRELRAAGWTVVRIWEHEDVLDAADRIEAVWRALTGRGGESVRLRHPPAPARKAARRRLV